MRAAALILAALAGCMPLKDVALEGAFDAATALDWSQTVDIAHKGQEGNPILGQRGEVVPPALYFPAVMALHAAVSAALPPGWIRTTWQALSLGSEAHTVWSNSQDGISLRIPF